MTMTTAEEKEARDELTRVASERVTWLAAAEIAQKEAEADFRIRRDEMAKRFRDLADVYNLRAKAASEQQDKLLKSLGMRP